MNLQNTSTPSDFQESMEISRGETLRHDAANGSLAAKHIINNGTIEIFSSNKDIVEAFLKASRISGDGAIVSHLPGLTLHVRRIESQGEIRAADHIIVESADDLEIQGGAFQSKTAHFRASGALKVNAHRIDAEVTAVGETISFGVAEGDLKVAESKTAGDPVWYNRAGDLDITPGATSGDDLYLFATGNITVGAIDTTGGDETHPGRIVIESGCVSITPDANPPIDDEVDVSCTDCDSVRESLNVVSAAEPAGTVIVNGNVSGKNLSIRADNVTVNGDLLIDADNNEEGGAAQIDFKTDVLIDGDVTVIGTSGKGKLTVSGTLITTTDEQNVSVTGTIDADVLIVTINDGTTSVEDIVGNSVEIFSGGDVTPGGTIDVSGTGANAGGAITVIASGILDLTNALFVADGGDTGNGGSVHLSSGSGNLTIASGLISAAAGQGTGSDASGGEITVESSADLTLSGNMSVDGIGAGAGGRITLRATDTLDLSTYTLSAEGGDTGDGGAVSLSSGSNFTLDPSKVVVDGGQGTGSDASGGGISADSTGDLTLSGSIALDGIGSGAGGAVFLSAGGTLSLSSYTISCDGGDTGNGGFVRLVSASNFTFDPTVVSVAAGQGTGSDAGGGAIEVESGADLTLSDDIAVDGTGEGAGGRIVLSAVETLSIGSNLLSADGGDLGDGGFIRLVSGDDVSLAAGQVSVSAGQDAASDGTGGTLEVESTADVTINEAIHLDGEGAGWGGRLLLSAGDTLTIGSYALSCDGGDTGGGGSIQLKSAADISIGTGQISASAGQGTESDGSGGTIEITSTANVTISDSLNVDGIDEGAGGRIVIDAGLELAIGSNDFSANGGDTGPGGFIHLGSADDLSIAGTQVSVDAGTGTGSNAIGGTVELVTTANLTVTGSIDANGVGEGQGGSILISAEATLDVDEADFSADGGSLGHGGAVRISSGSDLSLDGSQLSASGGSGTGADTNGGFITIETTDEHTLDLSGTFNVDGHGLGTAGSITVNASSTLTLTDAALSANSVAADNTVSGGNIDLSGYGLNIDSDSEITANGSSAGATGGLIKLTHFGTTTADINGLIRTNGLKGGRIEIKGVDGPIDMTATVEAKATVASEITGSIYVESPESITSSGACEAAGDVTFGAPVIKNAYPGTIYGNTINMLSGNQLSLELINQYRIETKSRGSVPFGQLKVGSALNNLPYKLTLKTDQHDTAFMEGNPIMVESAGDLYIEGWHAWWSGENADPSVLSAGETYTVNFAGGASVVTDSKLIIRGERINQEEGVLEEDTNLYGGGVASYSDIELTSDTRLIANLRQVDCLNLILNAEDVKAVALLNADFEYQGIFAKVSGEARSGDFVVRVDKYEANRGDILNDIPGGDVVLGDIVAAGSVEIDCRRGQITAEPGASISAQNGSVSIIQGTVRQGPLTLEDINIEALNGDVNIVIDHVPTEAPELDEGTQPFGWVNVIPNAGNVYWGAQGITLNGTKNIIQVPEGTENDQKVVFYTYGKGTNAIILGGDVRLTLSTDCPCDLPVDIGAIYHGNDIEPVGLTPGTNGQALVTHGTENAPGWGDPIKGLNWKGAWSSATEYVVDDAVFHNGESFIAVAENTDSEPPSSAWQLLSEVGDTGPTGPQGERGDENLRWQGSWSSATAYLVGDVVKNDGRTYISISNNTDDEPPSSAWELMAEVGEIGPVGSVGETGPEGDQGASGIQGEPGMIGKGAWDSGTSYVTNDIVKHQGVSYISVANSLNSEPPSSDWALLTSKGADGATGATGATGEPGPQGEQGPAGEAGAGSNMLFNGAFRFFQRQDPSTLTSRANGSYGPDRWYVLGDSGATDIQCVRDALDSTQAHACRIKNANASAKYTGIAQILPYAETIALRGKTVIFQGVAKTSSASRAMRAAILEWTGTQDAVAFGGSVGRDPILNWAATSYTAGNFFRNTNLTVVAVSSSFTPGTSYDSFSVSGTVSSSANNLILIVWEESATADGATWSLSQLGLYEGDTVQSWIPTPASIDFAQCAPFYQKSYEIETVAGTANAAGGMRFWSQVSIGASNSGQLAAGVALPFPAYKSSPTWLVYSTVTGNSGSIRNTHNNTDRTNVSANDLSSRGFRDLQCSTPGNISIGKDDALDFHWTMDSEL